MEITCYDKYGRVIENIVQWDVGQSISIKGYDLTSYAPQIHFANANSEKALVVESVLSGGLLSCQVPNSLARENLPIIMYIYDAVGETGKTNTIIKIPVTPRPMPDDVVYTDDVGVISLTEVLRQAREYMNNSLNYSTKAKESEEKAKTSADAAKVSETNAAKSENVASSSATQAAQSAKEAKAYVGSPLVANTVSAMTDQTKIYVYTGSESGYTAGNWYYHNGSAWVFGGVYNSSAVNVDKTLTQDGYAADAKVTGDAVSSLKEDLDEVTKRDCGIYFLNGVTETERNIAKNIKKIIIVGDVDFSGVRFSVVLNSENYPKTIKLSDANGLLESVKLGYDNKTGYNFIYLDSAKTKGILIWYDWDNHTSGINAEYANNHIELTGENSVAGNIDKLHESIEKNTQNLELLFGDVAYVKNDIYLKLVSKEATTHVGAYLTEYNTINAQQISNFIVETYEVTKGETVIISGSARLLSSYYLLCAFSSEQFADGLSVEPIKNGSTDLTEYHFAYTAINDGYIHCARIGNNGSVKVYQTVAPNKQIEILASALNNKTINDTDLEYSDYDGRYINTNGSIDSINNSVFHVLKFAVEANKCYKIYGNRVAIQVDTLPLASFSSSSFDGSTTITTNVIISGDGQSSVANDYDVDYTPPIDGYIYCAYVEGKNKLSVAKTKIVSEVIYKLTNSNFDTVKIQTFGDSITDEVWRSDKTTWATLIGDLIPQRKIDLVNSAVGGSGIGHGYANGGGRFPEKTEGNYVYDLMTDGTLRTDNDIVIMFVGTNNWAGNGALGQWGDNTVSTFYGSAKLICDYITQNTKSLFIVCTPCGRYNSVDETRDTNEDGEPINGRGKTLRDYCDALVKTCHFYGVPVLDLYYDLGWNRNNVKNFCSDGLHPTPDASKYIARIIASEIRRHLGI